MRLKNLFFGMLGFIYLGSTVNAQIVPSYVPTNGLVGWWPFNGNASDESGNGNNGTVNGATLTADRFGVVNNAYSTSLGYINCNNNNLPTNGANSISIWFKCYNDFGIGEVICLGNNSNTTWGTVMGNNYFTLNYGRGCGSTVSSPVSIPLLDTNWHQAIFVSSGLNGNTSIYFDGLFISNTTNANSNGNCNTSNLYFGTDIFSGIDLFDGNLDDIGIWNRALTQQEITNLYNAQNCAANLSINPSNPNLAGGSVALFTANTSDPNPTYVWQSDFGQGYVNLINYGNYSGANTANLSISNLQLSNHLQPIRAISTSGNCIDTSNVSIINISDTCINIVNDTNYISVTDTLFINTNISGLNPPNNSNTLKVFPNPANSHIFIDNGNLQLMSGYSIRIDNSLSQQVFQSPINQQQFYIDLSTWSGNGLYFLYLIDPQGNTVEVRKIVLQ